ncbi:hypothetical protein KBY79_13645 [Synechococcus lacustris C3-12m-Tous]|uniref:hypothetical protein n=1 Tax=Synechococcus lacustris TaxID=2116544 RepID=UPI0020CCA869|nr:hypothetical protein [Synechococcus lacustris]MCP9926248.1 hypothetical protein [Synechococcus lacustris C3-12m-Tous]
MKFTGANEFLRMVYRGVEQVMELHPTLKNTEELMSTWIDEHLKMSILRNGYRHPFLLSKCVKPDKKQRHRLMMLLIFMRNYNNKKKKEREDLLLDVLLSIDKGIKKAEYWSYEGVTDLLRKIYWQVEQVMRQHPELKDTQEVVEKWVVYNGEQWFRKRTEKITPAPLCLENIIQYTLEKDLPQDGLLFMRALGELMDRLIQTDDEVKKMGNRTNQWLKNKNMRMINKHEMIEIFLNEANKRIRSQQDREQEDDREVTDVDSKHS